MTEAVAVDVTRIVNRLRTLALDYDSRPIIVRRGVLPNLIRFLKSEDEQVKLLASETLRLLASHPENPKIMSEEANLVSTVCKVLNNKATHSTIKSNLQEVLINLADFLTEEQKESSLSLQVLLQTLKRKQQEPRDQHRKRNLVLSAEQLNSESARHEIQEVILSVKGIISFTCNIPERTIHLYTRTEPAIIMRALNDAGYESKIISDDLCSPDKRKRRSEDKENRKPEYLQPNRKVNIYHLGCTLIP